MADTLTIRLARIDAKITADRAHYLAALDAGHDGEADAWESEVDRLIALRARVESRGGVM